MNIKFNNFNTIDTIAAICSGINSTITIIRISGNQSKKICKKIFITNNKNNHPINNPKKLIFGKIIKSYNNSTESGFAVYMPSPKSFTGEDVIEIHSHGGNYNSIKILNDIINYGARQANNGEFTYRAFINNKIDLTQAEAISDLISSNNNHASYIAEQQLNGVLSKKIKNLKNIFINILTDIEAQINFPEENIPEIDFKKFQLKILSIEKKITNIYITNKFKPLLNNGIKIAIIGPSNSGKSTLLNTILGFNRAIISNTPGTTRDTIEESFYFKNTLSLIKLIDTAGIRQTNNQIEKLGIKKTLETIIRSQIILCLLDTSIKYSIKDIDKLKKILKKINNKPIIILWNKIDLLPNNIIPSLDNYKVFKISAKKQIGITQLLNTIEQEVNLQLSNVKSNIIISVRHAKLFEKILNNILTIKNINHYDTELISINVKNIINLLNNIIGINNNNLDIYKSIFSKFCIGK